MTLQLEQLCDPRGSLEVDDPATGEVIARVRTYTPAEVEEIVRKADEARLSWAARTAKERGTILRRWFERVLQEKEALARIVTAECDKPIAESRGEVGYAASFIEWFAEEGKRAYGETVPTFATGKRVLTIKQPIGTCAAITPWNFPLAMITRKAAPALAAGCSMVVKPAEATPLSALALEELAREAGLPEDLFRIVPADDPAEIGRAFCRDPRIRKLSFTGSTAVGKILMAQAADNVTKVSLELGGNAPFIVFDDADLDAAVEGALVSKYRNAGQTCVCANRFLVQEDVHDEFVRRLTARVSAFRIGPGSDETSHIGPLINRAAREKVDALVAEAIDAGASVVLGGPATAGNFYAPIVLTGVTADMAIATNEIFGPVAPILRFKDEDEAIRIANDTPFGLAAYFYARDVGRVWRVMEALEYGMVAVNEGVLSTEVAPFGGIKQSGIGREGSRHGLDEYLELKYCLLGAVDR